MRVFRATDVMRDHNFMFSAQNVAYVEARDPKVYSQTTDCAGIGFCDGRDARVVHGNADDWAKRLWPNTEIVDCTDKSRK